MTQKHHVFVASRWWIKAASGLSIFFAGVLLLGLGWLVVAAASIDGNRMGIPETVEGFARAALAETV